MAHDDAAQDAPGPRSNFRFAVDLGGLSASFQQVTGLDAETRPAEYRQGGSQVFYPIKLPGQGRMGDVTLHRGLFANDAAFRTWRDAIAANAVPRRTVVIRLLDEAGGPRMAWTLNDARPTRMSSTDVQSEGNEVAVESLDIAFETMVISAP